MRVIKTKSRQLELACVDKLFFISNGSYIKATLNDVLLSTNTVFYKRKGK